MPRSAKTETPPVAVAGPWKPLIERRQDRDAKRNAVLGTAARLFIAQGFAGTSMSEIAERLHITKPALYNYFAGKDEILLECFRLGHRMASDDLDAIEREPSSGLTRVRSFIRSYTGLMATEHGACFVRLSARELTGEAAQEVRRYKRAIDTRVRAFVTEGIADGSIAPCDVKLATFVIAGALNWVGHWYREGGASPDEVADAFSTLLISGLAGRSANGQLQDASSHPRRKPKDHVRKHDENRDRQ